MKNDFFILFYFITALCFNQDSFAQKAYNKDSLNDSRLQQAAGNTKEGYQDTAVKKSGLPDGYDPTEKWKGSREFSYMNYLDSLLREKSRLTTDSLHVNEQGHNVNGVPAHPGINKFLNSLPLQVFFWGFAIFFMLFILYRIFFKYGIFNNIRKHGIETEEEEGLKGLEDIAEYEALIQEAEVKNNFNLAIRYLYLQTLSTLSDKGLINFSSAKTNNDYLYEMASHVHYRQFSTLTRNYEYVWYGKFIISGPQYQKLKNEFISFNKNV